MALSPESQAIKEAMEETIAKLGIAAVRKLSWFPSSRPEKAHG